MAQMVTAIPKPVMNAPAMPTIVFTHDSVSQSIEPESANIPTPSRETLTSTPTLLDERALRAHRGRQFFSVVEQMGVSTHALGMPRRSLISKGVIDAPSRGILGFTIPGFAAFVRAQEDSATDPLEEFDLGNRQSLRGVTHEKRQPPGPAGGGQGLSR